jgi:hypothetical protein
VVVVVVVGIVVVGGVVVVVGLGRTVDGVDGVVDPPGPDVGEEDPLCGFRV